MTDTRNKVHFSDPEKVFFALSFSRLKENLETSSTKPHSILNKAAEHRSCNSTVSQKHILNKITKQSLRECMPMGQEINTL